VILTSITYAFFMDLHRCYFKFVQINVNRCLKITGKWNCAIMTCQKCKNRKNVSCTTSTGNNDRLPQWPDAMAGTRSRHRL